MEAGEIRRTNASCRNELREIVGTDAKPNGAGVGERGREGYGTHGVASLFGNDNHSYLMVAQSLGEVKTLEHGS